MKAALTTGFFLNRVFGKNFMKTITTGVRKIIPAIPAWSNHIRKPAKIVKQLKQTLIK